MGDNIAFDLGQDLVKVKLNQFYGIEIEPHAAHIARVAMWITDHQLNEATAQRFGTTRPTTPIVYSPPYKSTGQA